MTLKSTWLCSVLSVEEVIEQLKEDGYKKVSSVKAGVEYQFAIDTQCPNVLVFDAQNRDALEDSYLTRKGQLIIQVLPPLGCFSAQG